MSNQGTIMKKENLLQQLPCGFAILNNTTIYAFNEQFKNVIGFT